MMKHLKVLCLIILIGKTPAYSQQGEPKAVITKFFERQAGVRYVYHTSIHPRGTAVAWCADFADGAQVIYRADINNPNQTTRITACGAKPCHEQEPEWSPDGSEIAFLSEGDNSNQLQVYIANATTGKLSTPKALTKFRGHVSHLKWSPDGKSLSVLYVENASRDPNPMAAVNKAVGLIDSNISRDVQRLAVFSRQTKALQIISPTGLYVYEYSWSPDSRAFAYTAAAPPGDDNWYIAKFYKQSISKDTVCVYQPEFQIALPRWSPDAKQLSFIEGLMSDQGGTGGDIFVIDTSAGSRPRSLTNQRKSSPGWYTWRKDGSMLFTEFVGGSVAVNLLQLNNDSVINLWHADESIRAGIEETSLSVASQCDEPVVALIRSSWDALPEVYAGKFQNLKAVSNLNSHRNENMPRAKNIEWKNDSFNVQGWLLYPQPYDSSKNYPMLVSVHGGPAWITTPTWSTSDFNSTIYPQLGYFIFFPNPRGSHGQGQNFTRANRRDWGFGDFRDINSGIDAVAKIAPIDTTRLGIFGWSYGGSMAMFAVTQTNRFKAAVSGAGAADWLSYYGQNRIDKWMKGYFGASPYDDPAAYARSSAMSYIKNVLTPTLVLVGERDGEAPAPQSFQFWHALKERKVPTQLMVYENEGHAFEKFENMIDVSVRTIEWFNRYLK